MIDTISPGISSYPRNVYSIIKNGQSRGTDNIGYKTQNEDKQKNNIAHSTTNMSNTNQQENLVCTQVRILSIIRRMPCCT